MKDWIKYLIIGGSLGTTFIVGFVGFIHNAKAENEKRPYTFTADYVYVSKNMLTKEQYDGYFIMNTPSELLTGTKCVISRTVIEDNTVRVLNTVYRSSSELKYKALKESVVDGKLTLSSENKDNEEFKVYRESNEDTYSYGFQKYSSSGTTDFLCIENNYVLNLSGKNNGSWSVINTDTNKVSMNYITSTSGFKTGYISYSSSPICFSGTSGVANLAIYTDTASVVEAWGIEYLHMGQDTPGQCLDLYTPAKKALIAMGERYIDYLIQEDSVKLLYKRYVAWARARGDSDPFNVK